MLLLYVAVLVLLTTLAPYRFVIPETLRLSTAWTWLDLGGNLLFFFPVGFLVFFLLPRPRPGIALAWCTALSIFSELGQTMLPFRFAAPHDILCNVTGAALGIFLAFRLRARTLMPSLSLSTLVLVVALPMAWLASATTGRYPDRALALAPLGILAAVLIAEQVRKVAAGRVKFAVLRVAALSAGWYALSVLPGVRLIGARLLVQALLVGALGALWTWRPRAMESSTSGALIGFGLVLTGLGLQWWPLPFSPEPPSATLVMASMWEFNVRITIVELVEYLALMAVVGLWATETLRSMAGAVLFVLALGVAIEVGRAVHPLHSGELLRLVLGLGAAHAGALVSRQRRTSMNAFVRVSPT
ncbi:MAG: VanZ family protein [Myxococcota bacterium]|jgi:VanZ family protein